MQVESSGNEKKKGKKKTPDIVFLFLFTFNNN